MVNLKEILENKNIIYGYTCEMGKFVPYYDKSCLKINCMYCKNNKKVYAV